MKHSVPLAALLLLAACGEATHGGNSSGGNSSGGNSSGGNSSGGNSSGGNSSGGNSSAGNGPSEPRCPAQLPAQLGECEGELQCSYGDSPNFRCRAVTTCAAGRWEVVQGACSWQQPSACPNAEPSSGSACEPPNDAANLNCRYGVNSERDCVCHTCTRFDYCQADDQPGWSCKSSPTRIGCPELVPNVGSACAGVGRECSYGHWCIDGVVVRCTESGWALVEQACPE